MTEPTSQLTSKIDKKKSIILGIIGLVVIVLIFWKVIPQVGSYEDAFDALREMSWYAILLVGISVVLYLFLYGFPFKAATPGLRYWRSQQVNQAAFAISNGVPAGGAFGLAVQYAMLASYKVPGTVATAAITAVGLWSIFVSLGLPILGIAALAASGGDLQYAWVAPIGLAILVVGIAGFVLDHALGAARHRSVGAWATRCSSPFVVASRRCATSTSSRRSPSSAVTCTDSSSVAGW
jgi:uncharacterized membrane protein YbhN (UPF0104 family)